MLTVSPTTADVLDGFDDLSEWDDEELRRGQRRDRNGRFHGRPPKVVPAALHQEQTRRVLGRAGQMFVENTENAVAVLIDIANDLAAPYEARLKAASIIIERVMGKNPTPVDVTVSEPKFLNALRCAIVSLDDPDGEIIDVESYET